MIVFNWLKAAWRDPLDDFQSPMRHGFGTKVLGGIGFALFEQDSIMEAELQLLYDQRKFSVQNFRVTDIQQLFNHHSSYTTHHTPLIIHHSSYTTHHTPLIIHHSSYTTHHTPLIVHH